VNFLPQTTILPVSTFQVAGIRGMHHHAQPPSKNILSTEEKLAAMNNLHLWGSIRLSFECLHLAQLLCIFTCLICKLYNIWYVQKHGT
jgi:hypothetical protein